MKCRIGMGQMLVGGGEPANNLRRAADMIRQAGERSCHIVVLPECLDLGWTFAGARDMASPIPGERFEILSRAARAAGTFVVAGLTERSADRVYNSAVLISSAGELLYKHRKINELTIARSLYDTGESLGVAKTPLGTIGMTICADNFPDSLALGHAVARMGAQLLLSPCAWAVDGDHDNQQQPYGALWRDAYTSLASLYEIPVIGVSCVGWLTSGPWKGRKCIGCSLAVGAEGEILVEGPYGEQAETLLTIEVPIRAPLALGTDIAPMLRGKGYQGP